ncbi:adenylate kinase [uncultured Amnibacterium sp.]|uniref:adenylate kinase n=1 Tax=uncultured Amnibacterium sp. TaxID=1631851 RepID=UPI0035CBB899
MLIIGPPGAGKGTQATRIASAFDIPAISTGDIFRANVAQGTSLGRQAKTYMDIGAYVPDDLTNDLVVDRLQQPDAQGGFLLDGFPRTVQQSETLDGFLAERQGGLDAVVQLVVPEDEVVRRLLRRAAEQGRSDDNEDVIRARLAVYADQTSMLIQLYDTRSLLVPVDAVGDVDAVTQRIFDGLGSARAVVRRSA